MHEHRQNTHKISNPRTKARYPPASPGMVPVKREPFVQPCSRVKAEQTLRSPHHDRPATGRSCTAAPRHDPRTKTVVVKTEPVSAAGAPPSPSCRSVPASPGSSAMPGRLRTRPRCRFGDARIASASPPAVKEEPLLQVSTPRDAAAARPPEGPVKQERELLCPQHGGVKQEPVLQQPGLGDPGRGNGPSARPVPKKEPVQRLPNARVKNEELVQAQPPAPAVKGRGASSTPHVQLETPRNRGKRKRGDSAPGQVGSTADGSILQAVLGSRDKSRESSPGLAPPEKRRRQQPAETRAASVRTPPVKTEDFVPDEVEIVSERVVKQPPGRGLKSTKSGAAPSGTWARSQNWRRETATPSTSAPVVAPQTESEKTSLIEEYALYVVEREPETKAITWVVCKFCPIYGCQRRQRPYIMGYHVPLCREALDRHVEREHAKIWNLFKNASKEEKQAIFYRKRMPLNHVLQRRVAELKLSWGMKNEFTEAQQAAWHERGMIEKRWKKSSHARKKVTAKALARNLGIDMNISRVDAGKTGQRKESHAPRKRFTGEQRAREEAQKRKTRRELKEEMAHLAIDMNDRGSAYEVMSQPALQAAVERRKRYERRTSQHNSAT